MRGSCNADLRSGTLVFGRLNRRPFRGISGRLGIIGDRYVRFLLPDSSTRGCTPGHTTIHGENATQRKRNWHRSIGMISLRGVVHGITDRVSHHNLQPRDRNCWDLYCHTLWTLKMAYCLRTVVPHSNYTGGIQLFPVVFSRWVTPQYHHIQIALFELLAVMHYHQAVYWRA